LKQITLFNTSICSENTGDFIIIDAVKKHLYEIFPQDMFFETITHDRISKATYKLLRNTDYAFVGGTNLLSSNMCTYNQWKINLIDSFFLKNIILMGVGWWQYQKEPSSYTKVLLSKVLSKNILHSVRDSYTEQKLQKIGFSNIINTGCPTMWELTSDHCAQIPQAKAKNVVFTLTDYNPDNIIDQKLIDILQKNYDNIYFWPQGSRDIHYIKTLTNISRIKILGGNLFAFNQILEDKSLSLEYIGTRLHAGIRALQKKRRSIIIGIDNRSKEIAKDSNLKIIFRKDINYLDDAINNNFNTEIALKENNIKTWKRQFT